MDFMDVVLLSRIQFALSIYFHYLFPPITIGLGLLLVLMEGTFLKTGNRVYEEMTKFWVKIFAVVFGLGVASGIVMEFQFGTNWATYSRFVGDIFGSALAAEGIFAFFLESGFLAILVFGWNKVTPRFHFFSTIMVSLGSMFSAVWIVVANSWMQTPAGYRLVGRDANGVEVPLPEGWAYDPTAISELMVRAEITNFWEMVFNPSSMIRLSHVLMGCWILAGFVVMSISAFYILKNRHMEFATRSFAFGMFMALVSSVALLFTGHLSADVVAEHQPAKLAAMEGIFETRESTPLYLMGWPDAESGEVKYGVAVPGMLSFLVHGDTKTPVTGLDQFPREDWPPVGITFQTYHIMVALGMFFIALMIYTTFLWWRGKLFEKRWLMWLFVFAVILPYIGNYAGWTAAEVGRQPWIVYGLLRTSEGVSRAVEAGQVLWSILMFSFIYILLFFLFIYVLHRKIMHGPNDPEAGEAGAEGADQGFFKAAATRGPGGERLADEKAS